MLGRGFSAIAAAAMVAFCVVGCSWSSARAESGALDELRDAIRVEARDWDERLDAEGYSNFIGYAMVALRAEFRRAADFAPAITIVFGPDGYSWALVRMTVLSNGISFEGELITLEPDPRFFLAHLVQDPDLSVSMVLNRKRLAIVDRFVEGAAARDAMLDALRVAVDRVAAHGENVAERHSPELSYWIDVAIDDKEASGLWWGDECNPAVGGIADMILAMAGLHRNDLLRRFERPIPYCQSASEE